MRKIEVADQIGQLESEIAAKLETPQITAEYLTQRLQLSDGVMQLTSKTWTDNSESTIGTAYGVRIETRNPDLPPMFSFLYQESFNWCGPHTAISGTQRFAPESLPYSVAANNHDHHLYRSVINLARWVRANSTATHTSETPAAYAIPDAVLDSGPKPCANFLELAAASLNKAGTTITGRQSVYESAGRIFNFESNKVADHVRNLGDAERKMPLLSMRLIRDGLEQRYLRMQNNRSEVYLGLAIKKCSPELDRQMRSFEAEVRRPDPENISRLLEELRCV